MQSADTELGPDEGLCCRCGCDTSRSGTQENQPIWGPAKMNP